MADILEFLNQGRYRGRIRGTKAFVLLEILTATRSKNVLMSLTCSAKPSDAWGELRMNLVKD